MGNFEKEKLKNQGKSAAHPWRNSIGIEMIPINGGDFIMGGENGDFWDEGPAHKVSITQSFHISEQEITIEQFRQFRPGYPVNEGCCPYVSGISWYGAVEFCRWLSDKEGQPYRLPTEAEWEYVCRTSPNGEAPTESALQEPQSANPRGVKNMLSGVLEWCNDWYGEYEAEEQVDPVGSENGVARVIRGGSPDKPSEKWEQNFVRPANRAGLAPAFGHYSEDSHNAFGYHNIGFRVVQAPMPEGKTSKERISYARQGIKQKMKYVKQGPDANKPYFRKRYLLPTPPENSPRKAIDAAGLPPAFRGHNHSPGVEICSNGDVLLISYTSYYEYEPGVSLIAARLRYGAEEWDMPDVLFDFPSVNDHAPMLWNDEGALHFFWGNPRLDNAFPFQWISSGDNGATWTDVKFPYFENEVGEHSKQPINTAFRGQDGAMYVASDAKGPTSVIWASHDNGKTWRDPQGRTCGRHTTFASLKDGGILGMGGKHTDIDGYMPKSISHDGGTTWEVTRTPLPAQGGNQRPCIIRLASGRLFFAADFQDINGNQPEGIRERGSYAALSEDEGETWRIRKLWGTQPHENPKALGGSETLGYSVARQAPNGMIHLITTMNNPCLHFEFNEAWILDDSLEVEADKMIMESSATDIPKVERYQEIYPDGQIRVSWSGGIADDGRFLLHGNETWYYPGGQKHRETHYEFGRKTGQEIYWSEDGKKLWTWEYDKDGRDIWNQWWPNGAKKSVTEWKDFHADGQAVCWDRDGVLISQRRFREGVLLDSCQCNE